MQKVLAQSLVTIEEIVGFIIVGRARVLKTKADPYRMLFQSELRPQFTRDAKRIYSWFSALCESGDSRSIVKALKSIRSIAKGPHKFIPYK